MIMSKRYRGLQALEIVRKMCGFSRPEAAAAAGISHSSLFRIEKGESEMTGETMKSLARAYRIKPDDIKLLMTRGIVVDVGVVA